MNRTWPSWHQTADQMIHQFGVIYWLNDQHSNIIEVKWKHWSIPPFLLRLTAFLNLPPSNSASARQIMASSQEKYTEDGYQLTFSERTQHCRNIYDFGEKTCQQHCLYHCQKIQCNTKLSWNWWFKPLTFSNQLMNMGRKELDNLLSNTIPNES